MLDLYLIYSFIKRLSTPFKEWEAFKLGIIDEKGNILIPRKNLRMTNEKNAFGIYDLMILNLKKMLSKLPGGDSKLASYAAALYLIREWNHFGSDSMLNESVTDEQLTESLTTLQQYVDFTLSENFVKNFIDEEGEGIANSVGAGNIAGIGIGPDGEPGFSKKAHADHKKRNKNKKRLRDIIGKGI